MRCADVRSFSVCDVRFRKFLNGMRDFHSRQFNSHVFSQFGLFTMEYENSKRHHMAFVICKVSQLFFASGTCCEKIKR